MPEIKRIIDNITIITDDPNLSDDEIKYYIDQIKQKNENKEIKEIKILIEDDEYANVSAVIIDKPFERIRRITGYLVGTLDRFNNAKRAEESMRVKHN